MVTNVIVGVDHQDGGRDAIALAMQLLGRGGELTFGHVRRRAGPISRRERAV